jgi:hypothetical protein
LFSRQEALELYHAYRSEPGDTDLISPEDSFIVLMILAISVLSSKSKDYRQLVSLAESLRRDAFSRIQFDILTSNTSCSSVRRLILIAQYGFFLPSSTNLWQVVGDATRMALELGLHEEVPEHPGIDEIAVDSRRRLFWVVSLVSPCVLTI